jgi:uncharacterized membrane protein YjjP (DUF1212 family)
MELDMEEQEAHTFVTHLNIKYRKNISMNTSSMTLTYCSGNQGINMARVFRNKTVTVV